MNDTDWRLIYELYRNPNITKVSNILYISQPSLTKRLQRIEAEFDVTIVERTPKGLEFTEAGKYLAEQSEAYLKLLQQTKGHLEEMREATVELLTIGAAYTYSRYTLTDQLIRYRMAHPNVGVTVKNQPSNLLFRGVLEETLDVAFVRGDYEGAVNRIFMGKNHAYVMSNRPIDSFDELKQLNRLWYITNEESRVLIDQWWRGWFGEEAPTGQSLGYIDVVWQMVQHGLGYSICFLPEEYTNPYNLCLKPLVNRDGSPVSRNTWFLYPKNKRLSPVVEDFVQFIQKDTKGLR